MQHSLFRIISSVLFIYNVSCADKTWKKQFEAIEIANGWVKKLGDELTALNEYARKYEAEKYFETTEDVRKETGEMIRERVAKDIRSMMDRKTKSVQAIRDHTEKLSLYRKPDIFRNSSFEYYDTNTIEKSDDLIDNSIPMKENLMQWSCDRPSHLAEFKCDDSILERTRRDYASFNYMLENPDSMKVYERKPRNLQLCRNISYIDRGPGFYDEMYFQPHAHFDAEVNTNHSIVKVVNNVFNRDTDVLNGIRYSEALDQSFQCNFKKDPTLTWQYFASQKGFIRYYPATKWSDEDYDQTYDYRIRSWYTEALTSAKDIVILVDNSGSIRGNRRLISKIIVNNILDTLTDNDYVNIYTFTNSTSPVVFCFNNTMVQANEENLRLFRENITEHRDDFVSDITLGLEVAFPLLMKHRKTKRKGQICNQAIMLITEGVDYDYDVNIFKKYNNLQGKSYYGPIRIFTYLLGTEPQDARRMEWIACANMGFYVNISTPEEVQEKVFKYLEVMSRPINLNVNNKPQPAWSALYIHLADRRLSNWLWKKSEGIRQRNIFIKLGRERMERKGFTLKKTQRHYTQSDEHPYKQYEEARKFIYMITVSVPVYDRRQNRMSLLGVAGVDVPLDLIKKLTLPHKIGVNGYAFILTNNGYALLHPHHRTIFGNNMLKPTYNRVDMTEVEITNETIEPRKFDMSVIELRQNMVLQRGPGVGKLFVKTALDNMKRVLLTRQHYFYTAIGPFTLAIVLPDKYGNLKINHPDKTDISELIEGFKLNQDWSWTIHPEWEYCRHPKSYNTNEFDLVYFLKRYKLKWYIEKYCNSELTNYLLRDLRVTEWFLADLMNASALSKHTISVFIATHSGLTRWKQLQKFTGWNIETVGIKAIDEDWYKRAVEINYHTPDMFLFSLPSDIDDANDFNDTLITASHAIFQTGPSGKTPVAVVGYQLYFKAMLSIYLETTKHECKSNKSCKLSCETGGWFCYVIDNDGYIILHHNYSLIGKPLADVNMVLVDHLVKDNVLVPIKMFDYQGTCFPRYTSDKPYYGPDQDVAPETKCNNEIKCKTIEFLRHAIKKTIPTPCDTEYRMYHVVQNDVTNIGKEKSNFCTCPYIATPIKNTNLLFILQQGNCCHFDDILRTEHRVNEFPREIIYNSMSMACYIGTQNNYTVRNYKTCISENEVEFTLNSARSYCKIL